MASTAAPLSALNISELNAVLLSTLRAYGEALTVMMKRTMQPHTTKALTGVRGFQLLQAADHQHGRSTGMYMPRARNVGSGYKCRGSPGRAPARGPTDATEHPAAPFLTADERASNAVDASVECRTPA